MDPSRAETLVSLICEIVERHRYPVEVDTFNSGGDFVFLCLPSPHDDVSPILFGDDTPDGFFRTLAGDEAFDDPTERRDGLDPNDKDAVASLNALLASLPVTVRITPSGLKKELAAMDDPRNIGDLEVSGDVVCGDMIFRGTIQPAVPLRDLLTADELSTLINAATAAG